MAGRYMRAFCISHTVSSEKISLSGCVKIDGTHESEIYSPGGALQSRSHIVVGVMADC